MDKKKIKSSWYLPEDILEAMQVVFNDKRVQKSHQIEMGMKLYLKEHKSLLKSKGVDVWK